MLGPSWDRHGQFMGLVSGSLGPFFLLGAAPTCAPFSCTKAATRAPSLAVVTLYTSVDQTTTGVTQRLRAIISSQNYVWWFGIASQAMLKT
eukprot:8839568-Pyramimonas_sp.AAC.1